MTNAFLDFHYSISSENIFDYVQVLANDVPLGGFSGNGSSHARYALDSLTKSGFVGRLVISFDFMSDFSVTGGGFQIDNIAITGDLAASPVSGVPEPASWAIMVMGFGALGAAMRQRRATGHVFRV